MSREVVVVGAGLHRYGVFPELSIAQMGTQAVRKALEDANMRWEDVQEAYCGSMAKTVFFPGHQVCGAMGHTGLAVTNVENASASGSSAFREAYLSIAAGSCDVALAMGIDKNALAPPQANDPSGKGEEKNASAPAEKKPSRFAPVHRFAEMARAHMQRYGTTIDQLALVSVKSHYNASLNPFAQFQKAVSLEEVHQARMVADPLTVLHCCPVGDGAAAVILCAKEVATKYTAKLCPTVTGSILRSILPDGDPTFNLTRHTAGLLYEKTGTKPEDLDLIELHDAFTIEEILYLEALGLCEPGQGGRLVEAGVTALNGEHPVNSSGGLISMGHPIGPTGVGQIAEILWQMRRQCGQRQIRKEVRLAMAHMVGAGGVCIIHLLRR